jgi:hypothetical protein
MLLREPRTSQPPSLSISGSAELELLVQSSVRSHFIITPRAVPSYIFGGVSLLYLSIPYSYGCEFVSYLLKFPASKYRVSHARMISERHPGDTKPRFGSLSNQRFIVVFEF